MSLQPLILLKKISKSNSESQGKVLRGLITPYCFAKLGNSKIQSFVQKQIPEQMRIQTFNHSISYKVHKLELQDFIH